MLETLLVVSVTGLLLQSEFPGFLEHFNSTFQGSGHSPCARVAAMASHPLPMNEPLATISSAAAEAAGNDELLARFLRESPAARAAAASLRSGAEVGVFFTNVAGEWRFYSEGGTPALERRKAQDPDFDLRLAPGAVKDICAQPDADIGDLGVAVFEHMVARDPERKIRVTLRSGLIKLTVRGWLSVLAQGGPKVVAWMARKGLRGPGAVAAALARLKK